MTERSEKAIRTVLALRTVLARLAQDHAVRAYYETFGLPVAITNCCNNYGPYQFPEKVIPLFATYALSGKRLPIYQSSQNRREWIHVSDHCKAIAAVLNHGRVGEDLRCRDWSKLQWTRLPDWSSLL